MANFLESEILNKFLSGIKADAAIPNSLVEAITKLNDENKISKSSHLKKLIEEFAPVNEATDESK